ncbi:F-box protein At3g07870-like [Papaver somniferum]|uniref:F-box protein At3g07870-like n=1 Tax=Papaver somniferum TaxID=3469 RepID=UPI000E704474|nr:F-box protein At3g07870-like [Papaver somniferum]
MKGSGEVGRRRKRSGGLERKGDLDVADGESNSITKVLPNEVIVDIFSRLPIRSASNCKLVCRNWCEVIRSPLFRETHLHRALLRKLDNTVSFLFLTLDNDSRLYHGSHYEDREPYMEFRRINHPHIKKKYGKTAMVGSCNGLVCFSKYYPPNISDPIYICNPILGEQITLRKFLVMVTNKNNVVVKKTSYLDGEIVSGFGYNSIADEYKIVRIYHAAGGLNGQVQVYTLGSGSGWRDIGEIPYLLKRHEIITLNHILTDSHTDYWEIYNPSRGILANGALHWFDQEWEIVAFDLAEEQFSLLPSPNCDGVRNFLPLQVLEGRLCVASRSQDGNRLEILSFNKASSEWENMFSISCRSDDFKDVYWPISLTLSGKLILRSNYETLICYDPQTGEFKEQMVRNTDTHVGLKQYLT